MRVLGNQPYVKKADATMPFGATIQNETETQEGTPVVEEVLGDVLMNMYRLLELTETTPTNNQDNDSTQYQIVEALKKLPNSLNDVERVLSLTGTVWSVDLKLSLLPNKYFFLGRANADYKPNTIYTFKGLDASPIYSITSSGFSANDEVLVIIDASGVRAYSLTAVLEQEEITLAMGNPLSFNDTNVLMYEDNGTVYTDLPSSNQLQPIIRTESALPNLVVNDIYLMMGYVLCFCFNPDANEYVFYQFESSNLTDAAKVFTGGLIGIGTDYAPYVYADGKFLFMTNAGNSSTFDYSFKKFEYKPLVPELTLVSSFDIDNTFTKTSNACVKNDKLVVLTGGTLSSYNLATGIKTVLGIYNSIVGRIFNFNRNIYFTSGEVGKKWTI